MQYFWHTNKNYTGAVFCAKIKKNQELVFFNELLQGTATVPILSLKGECKWLRKKIS